LASLKNKVSQALRGLALRDPEITVDDSTGSVLATVVSASFTGMDEAERQRLVWNELRATLEDRERVAVEFVFTLAPEEQEAEEAV
jgi:acid stress-induced BolA-like protein IbaG/YrbA